MTVRIPKYVIEDVTQKTWTGKILAGLGLLSAGLLIGYFSSNIYVKHSLENMQQQNDALEIRNQELHTESEQLKSEISLQNAEIKVKTEAASQLQSQYQELLAQQDSYKSEIKFFQQLLNPQGTNRGLRVFQAQLKSGQEEHLLILSLAQKIERASVVSGSVKLEITGTQGDENTTYHPEPGELSYQFKYYQNLSFRFSLPEGFQARELVVELIPSSKKSKAIKQSFSWEALQQTAG